MNMYFSTPSIISILLLPFTYLLYKLFIHPNKKTINKKPPGPTSLPILGNLHLLGTLPHRSLRTLSKKHGPIMSLQLGQIPTIIISSSKAAESFLKTHDIVFASRPKTQASEFIFFGSKGLAFSEYGPYWRSVKKLCSLKLLSSSKVEMFGPIRKEKVEDLVKCLRKDGLVGEVVDMSEAVENLIEEIVYKMIFGKSKFEEFDIKKFVHDGMALLGAFNLADFIPWLGPFDLQGLTRACKKTGKSLDDVLEMVITEHEQTTNANNVHHENFMDILLSMMHQTIELENEQSIVIDRTNIKAILLDMIVAGIDTSATTIEWGLSELLRNPRVMKKLQDEIQNEVGNKRMVEENDLPKLNYLGMVVDEILRLYPVGPLLIPRECRESVTIDGYFIKEKTRVMINAWAIARDPRVWSENAEEFYPERFIDKKMNYLGQELESIPFGSGRRRCPGIQVGLVNVRLVIAQLVHCFNWKLPHNINPLDLNMDEKFGITIPRAQHLYAIPSYRLVHDDKIE